MKKYNLCTNILNSQSREGGGLGFSRITLLYGIRKIAMNAVNPCLCNFIRALAVLAFTVEHEKS